MVLTQSMATVAYIGATILFILCFLHIGRWFFRLSFSY